MEYQFHTSLKGNIGLTDCFHLSIGLQKDKSLYKFIWVRSGQVIIEVDHVELMFGEDEIICLSPLQHIAWKKVTGTCLTLLFNSNFYCIYGHDNEVSCNGFLFNGTSDIMCLHLSLHASGLLNDIVNGFVGEYQIKDSLQEEMLRLGLKRFIITCTRIAREKHSITQEKEKSFNLVRQFYVLVDNYFKEKKKVQEYAEMLHRSPKTLSNLFSVYGLPTPLHIIHERIEAEAKRLLLYTSKSVKQIADILGFEDLASLSRFFKNMTGESISDYRKREKGKN